MNIQKLLEGRKILLDGDVDLDDPMNQVWVAIGPKQEQELLLEVRVSNRDYGDPIFDGTGKTLRHWFGMNFIVTNRLILTSGERECGLWARSGMHLGVWQDIKGEISKRADLVGKPFDMEATSTFGATRVQEEKVMKILCKE
ncbi:MAG: hypothetical protein IIB38_09425 [Candidatus Hydrogenedentes bacterium]|nr:hypothetical protein [Candidatus Hydrogenedentota bacterium]